MRQVHIPLLLQFLFFPNSTLTSLLFSGILVPCAFRSSYYPFGSSRSKNKTHTAVDYEFYCNSINIRARIQTRLALLEVV
jgi:hypothetical protein